jgi:glutamate racemase
MQNKIETLKIIFTDSGLGGLSILADVFNIFINKKPLENVELIYFNSTPNKQIGYNKLKSEEEKISVFNRALYSMKENFNPDFIFIACNTLSVIYEQTIFSKREKIPIEGIVEYGLLAIREKLLSDVNSQLIILGTPTTINKNIYKLRLIENGVDQKRIINQACPDLESEIQKDPESSTTKNLIQLYLNEAISQIIDKNTKVFLALCCTHYGFAEKVFEATMKEMNWKNFEIINPNKKWLME